MELEDFLKHYGVLGMHWGIRKEEFGAPRLNRRERRALKRKTKAAGIRKQATEQQALIDDLKKNGTRSKFMAQKYGAPMVAEGRAADMAVMLLRGHSKKSLLAAEIKSAEHSRDHFLEDARLASEGKMTNKQKMLLGAAVVGGMLAAGIGAVVIKNLHDTQAIRGAQRYGEFLKGLKEAEDKFAQDLKDGKIVNEVEERAKLRAQFKAKALAEKKIRDAIGAGDKISFEDYWAKLMGTEVSRVSGISKDAFEGMSETPITVPPGQVFHRMSTDDEKEVRDRVFAAFKDEDVNRYKAVLPDFWKQWGIGGPDKGGYDVQLKSLTEIRSPSEKARVKAFIDILGQKVEVPDASGAEFVDLLAGDTHSPSTKTVLKSGRELLKDQFMLDWTKPGWNEMTDEQLGLAYYRNFALEWTPAVQNRPLRDAYFKKFADAGFNALVDDNDAGKLSEAPMMIFNATKTMQRVGATPVTPEAIKAARSQLIEIARK